MNKYTDPHVNKTSLYIQGKHNNLYTKHSSSDLSTTANDTILHTVL